jgi:hypothetical protein
VTPILNSSTPDFPLFQKRNDAGFDSHRYLYHYTSWTTLPEIAYSKSIRLNSISRMNDPRESKDWLLGVTHRGRPDVRVVDQLEFAGAVSKYKRHLKLIALGTDVSSIGSLDPFLGAGFARPTMWAHYAGNHTGACIVFDRSALERRFMTESTDVFGQPSGVIYGPVQYTADSLGGDSTLKGVSADSIRVNGPERAVQMHFEALKHKIWFQKHSDWLVEAEYRFVYYDPVSKAPILVNVEGCIVGLILGADFRESHLSMARDFDRVFDIQGCVAQCEWEGPRWHARGIHVQDDQWFFAPSNRSIPHSGIEITVQYPSSTNKLGPPAG